MNPLLRLLVSIVWNEIEANSSYLTSDSFKQYANYSTLEGLEQVLML